ncbi:transcription initiation factor tfiid [Anaeramoeba flamelloides]|uniref:Transcription initiation factor tfiid n=1 Tax=Anaeramoeba flamelloides TaxID=1746091 RepID=A0AAV8A7F3_9EUKA|nr:transcription initiation factor tfiid [Anaeramoeba flamelloides]
MSLQLNESFGVASCSFPSVWPICKYFNQELELNSEFYAYVPLGGFMVRWNIKTLERKTLFKLNKFISYSGKVSSDSKHYISSFYPGVVSVYSGMDFKNSYILERDFVISIDLYSNRILTISRFVRSAKKTHYLCCHEYSAEDEYQIKEIFKQEGHCVTACFLNEATIFSVEHLEKDKTTNNIITIQNIEKNEIVSKQTITGKKKLIYATNIPNHKNLVATTWSNGEIQIMKIRSKNQNNKKQNIQIIQTVKVRKYGQVRTITFLRNGNIFAVPSDRTSISFYKKDENGLYQFLVNRKGLENGEISVLYESNNGNLWVANENCLAYIKIYLDEKNKLLSIDNENENENKNKLKNEKIENEIEMDKEKSHYKFQFHSLSAVGMGSSKNNLFVGDLSGRICNWLLDSEHRIPYNWITIKNDAVRSLCVTETSRLFVGSMYGKIIDCSYILNNKDKKKGLETKKNNGNGNGNENKNENKNEEEKEKEKKKEEEKEGREQEENLQSIIINSEAAINCLENYQITDDLEIFAGGDGQGYLHFFNNINQKTQSFQCHSTEIWDISYNKKKELNSNDQKVLKFYLITSSEDFTSKIWKIQIQQNTQSQKQIDFQMDEIQLLTGHKAAVTCNVWSNDLICTGSDDATVRVYSWDKEQEKAIFKHTINANTLYITYMKSISKDGSLIALVTEDGFLIIYDIINLKQIAKNKAHLGSIEGLEIINQTIYTCGSDNIIQSFSLLNN